MKIKLRGKGAFSCFVSADFFWPTLSINLWPSFFFFYTKNRSSGSNQQNTSFIFFTKAGWCRMKPVFWSCQESIQSFVSNSSQIKFNIFRVDRCIKHTLSINLFLFFFATVMLLHPDKAFTSSIWPFPRYSSCSFLKNLTSRIDFATI